MIRSKIFKLIPWVITVVALFLAFRGVDWAVLYDHLGDINVSWLLLAVFLTCVSYLLRARRWQDLFPGPTISYTNAAKVLILGFFMNNILPARAGELVRAHLGAKVTGETRTLVLATIASERLADGLALSLFFLAFAFGLGDAKTSQNLFYVACFFGVAALGVIITLNQRDRLFKLAEKINGRFDSRASNYTLHRIQVFINGLAPLWAKDKLPKIAFWTFLVWTVELGVYFAVTRAFGTVLDGSDCTLFMVAVNFSSLIPAAPGGIGVIEYVASAVLNSIGVAKELALTMVLAQHVIQYLVVGIPGAIIMLTWKGSLRQIQSEEA